MAKVKIGNVKGPQGEQGPQGPTGATGATGQVDASTAIEFEENSSYANIESGESIATIFGKLKKIAGGILAGAGSTLLGANLTADRVLLSNSDGKITASTITATELAYLDGLTGNVQQNINSLTEKNIKVDLVEATTNQYSNIFLEQYGYTTDNTIFAHVVDGAKGANVSAKLYTYNGNLFVLIGEVGSNTAFADTKVTLKILHI